MATPVSARIRQEVAHRAGYRCEYCGLPQAFALHVHEPDHIVPRQHRGESDPQNLAWTCFRCNDHKSSRIAALDPLTGTVVRLFNPRHHVWREHFAWTTEGDRVLGLTPTGRATVAALHLNRPSLVKARQAWVSVGWHPPTD